MLARDESRGHPMGFNPWIFTIEKKMSNRTKKCVLKMSIFTKFNHESVHISRLD